MTLRFASLGSGSRGNALLVESDGTLLMVDCGLPHREVVERLGRLGRDPRDVTALLVTHEHADHVRGVAAFARRYGTAVWMTPGTASVCAARVRREVRTFSCHRRLVIGDIAVEPFPVPHDAREPCQFVFVASGRRLGVLTDTGHVTPHITERLAGCDALALECNHDLQSLWAGPYPPTVKARVASRLGHLDNRAAAELLGRIGHGGLQWVMSLHISEQNNSWERVRAALEPVLYSDSALHLAEQDRARGWLGLE